MRRQTVGGRCFASRIRCHDSSSDPHSRHAFLGLLSFMTRRNSDSPDAAHRFINRFRELTLGKYLKAEDQPKPKPSSGSRPSHSRTSSNPEFVGGFRQDHGRTNANHPYDASGSPGHSNGGPPLAMPQPFGAPAPPQAGDLPLPRPPSGKMFMPEPTHYSPSEGMSRTTQIAWAQYNDPEGKILPSLPIPPAVPVRPHSDSALRQDTISPTRPQPDTNRPPRPSIGPPTTHTASDALGVPDSPSSGRGRSHSSPGSMPGTITCSGTTKSGEPCKNPVKRPTALGHVDSDADKEIERYCHLHLKEVLKPTGFHSPKANEWVDYGGEWIDPKILSLSSWYHYP